MYTYTDLLLFERSLFFNFYSRTSVNKVALVVMMVLLKYTQIFFKLIGYWPLETNNSRFQFIYKIYFYLTMTIFILVAWSVCLEVPNSARNGMKKFVSNVSVGAQFMHGVIKFLCLSLPVMGMLVQKVIVTEKNIFESGNGNGKAIYRKYCKMNNKLNEYMIAVTIANAGAFIITPWIMKKSDLNTDELSLPLECYLPFDYREYFKIALFLNVTGGLVVSIYISACNMTYVGLMVFIISQLEILKLEIVEGVDATRFTDKEIHQNLRKIVMYYNNITKFMTDFNRVMKFLNLLYFLICIAHTSMIGFEVVTDDFSFQLIRNIWYLVTSLVADLFTWYWFGNKITVQHASLWNAIWESDWYNCNIKNKKTTLVIMMQFQKPLRLSVGFSHFMSLETMVMLLKTSMSYTITLKQFYAMKEANN